MTDDTTYEVRIAILYW